MKTKSMTNAEIERKYPDEWILLVEPDVDEDGEVLSGIVVIHSKNRDKVYAKLVELKPKDSALLFTGKSIPGMEYVLAIG